MKKLICILMAVLLIVPSLCYADVSLLQWGMTKEDVVAQMGEPTKTVDNDSFFSLLYEDAPIGDYTGLLCLVVYNDSLLAKVYYLNDENPDREKYVSLCSALEAEYGSATNDVSLFYSFTVILMGQEKQTEEEKAAIISELQQLVETGDLKTWENIEDTGIAIGFSQTDHSVELYCFQRPGA